MTQTTGILLLVSPSDVRKSLTANRFILGWAKESFRGEPHTPFLAFDYLLICFVHFIVGTVVVSLALSYTSRSSPSTSVSSTSTDANLPYLTTRNADK